MKTTKTLLFCLFTCIVLVFIACSKPDTSHQSVVPQLPETKYSYEDELPNHLFSQQGNVENLDAKATLGRVLFYDESLSLNHRVSCGTCHQAQFAFADGKKVSEGWAFETTPRNSMALCNVGSMSQFFWDNREDNLDDQVIQPILNHIEMGMDDISKIVERVNDKDYYGPLFDDAFGDGVANGVAVSEALSVFLSNMNTYRSKYDEGMQNQWTNFTAAELAGKDLFYGKMLCGNCHGSGNLDGWGSGTANIGLDITATDPNGTGPEGPGGWSKIPSLKNIMLTGPYMHDGRFETIDDVLDHYSTGIKDHPALDWRLLDLDDFDFGFFDEDITLEQFDPIRLNMTDIEREQLKAFLRTTTDYEYVNDIRYSDPFVLIE